MTRRRAVVVGDVAVDVVVRVLERSAHDSDAAARTRLTGGGAGGNVAAWLAALDVPVTLVGRVGDDPAGAQQREELRRRGVALALRVDPEAATGTVVVLAEADGARSMYPDRGANLRLAPADLPDPLGRAGDHLHLSGYALLDARPRPAALAALAAARRAGLTTSVDASSAAPLARCREAFPRWTAGVDLLRANEAEARVLAPDASGPADAARRLAAGHGAVVVTAGASGAWVATADGTAHVPARRTAVVDTVGAGDALTAGYLAAHLAGAAPPEALAAGVELATRAVGTSGARPPLPPS